MQDVPFSWLRSFVVFNESPNISEAARRLGLTQPALSKHLKALEEASAQPLYTFQGSRKVLTVFGRELHAQLKEPILSLPQKWREVETRFGEPARARLRIAGRRGLLDRIAPRLQFAGVIEFRESSNEEIIRDLLERKIEMGLTSEAPDRPELRAQVFLREQFILALPKILFSRAPSLRSGDGPQKLVGPAVLAYKNPDPLLAQFAKAAGLSYEALKIQRFSDNYGTLAALVKHGQGWALLPEAVAQLAGDAWILPVTPMFVPEKHFYLTTRLEWGQLDWFRDLQEQICAPARAGSASKGRSLQSRHDESSGVR